MSRSLTVVIPTRDRADYLGTALASVAAAGEEARRRHGITTSAIVVDDCSDDDGATARVAELWGARYHRITEHDGRNDPGQAILAGLGMVDSELFQLLGDDDALLPFALTCAAELVDEGADLVSPSFWRTTPDLRPTRLVVVEQPDLGDLARGYSTVCDVSVMRTELAHAYPFDVSLEAVMLLPFWVHLALEQRTFVTTSYPTWLYRRHDANISATVSDEARALRARVVADLQAQVVARLGALPPSPHEDAEAAKAAREAEQEAARAEKERLAAERAEAAAQRAARNKRLDRRIRGKIARTLAP